MGAAAAREHELQLYSQSESSTAAPCRARRQRVQQPERAAGHRALYGKHKRVGAAATANLASHASALLLPVPAAQGVRRRIHTRLPHWTARSCDAYAYVHGAAVASVATQLDRRVKLCCQSWGFDDGVPARQVDVNE